MKFIDMGTNTMSTTVKIVIGVVVVVLGAAYLSGVFNQPRMNPATNGSAGVMMNDQATDVTKAPQAPTKNAYATFHLTSQNGSGITGDVILMPKGEKTEVLLSIVGEETEGVRPAHIHAGACPAPGAVKYPLSPVKGGKSLTVIDASVEQLMGMLPLAVNVHKSPTEAKIYVACGDINNSPEAYMAPAMMKDAMVKPTTSMQKDGAMMQADTMMKVGSYEAYAPEKIAKAGTGNVVLFFHASWCPTCRTLDADIKASLEKIPGNLTILDVDYDNSTDLKKKYGVTYQHTFVQVDKDGKMIKKWMGSPTLSALMTEVK